MKTLFIIALLCLGLSLQAQNIDTLSMNQAIEAASGKGRFQFSSIEVADGGFIWLGGRYEVTDIKIDGNTAVFKSDGLKLQLVFLNKEHCVLSIFTFPGGVLRSYYNQDKLD